MTDFLLLEQTVAVKALGELVSEQAVLNCYLCANE